MNNTNENQLTNSVEKFELVNTGIEKWTDIQFVESDPYQENQTQCEIVLCVDWEAENVVVETRMQTFSTPMREWNKLNQCFRLPEMVDASNFLEHYNRKIKPLLQARGETFESYFDGSNWKGRFESDEDNDQSIDEADIDIQDACDKSPEHDKSIFFSIGGSFDNYSDIIDILEYENIDFMTADLEDEKVVDSIMSELTDEYIFLNTDNQEELKSIRESIIENRQE